MRLPQVRATPNAWEPARGMAARRVADQEARNIVNTLREQTRSGNRAIAASLQSLSPVAPYRTPRSQTDLSVCDPKPDCHRPDTRPSHALSDEEWWLTQNTTCDTRVGRLTATCVIEAKRHPVWRSQSSSDTRQNVGRFVQTFIVKLRDVVVAEATNTRCSGVGNLWSRPPRSAGFAGFGHGRGGCGGCG